MLTRECSREHGPGQASQTDEDSNRYEIKEVGIFTPKPLARPKARSGSRGLFHRQY